MKGYDHHGQGRSVQGRSVNTELWSVAQPSQRRTSWSWEAETLPCLWGKSQKRLSFDVSEDVLMSF